MLNYYQLLATGNWKLATVLSPSIRDTQYEIRSTKVYVRKNNLFMQNKAKFRKVKLNVNNVLTGDYGIMDTWLSGKKQSQTNPNKAKSKKAEMNVTSILTVGYENISPIRAPKKQSQMSKRQKPMQTSLTKGIMKKTAFSGSEKTNPNKPNACPPLRLAGLPAICVAGQAGFRIRFCKNPADLLSQILRNREAEYD